VERGLEPLALEAGDQVGAAVREWGHVRLFSPWEYDVDAAALRLRTAPRATAAATSAAGGPVSAPRALERQAAVDSLTGLVTRRVLDDALASALSASASDRGTALVLVDVDRFESINDGHGHPVGDDALVHLARVLTGTVRAGDAVVSRGAATSSPR